MKRNNKKLATFILAGALSCSAFLGTAFLNGSVAASADEAKAKTYALSGCLPPAVLRLTQKSLATKRR